MAISPMNPMDRMGSRHNIDVYALAKILGDEDSHGKMAVPRYGEMGCFFREL